MAVSRVQRTDGHGKFLSNLATSAFASSNTAGNAIVALINTSNGGNEVSSVTDSAGNTYTFQCSVNDPTSLNSIEIWLAQNINFKSGNIVTAHDAGSFLNNIIAIEVAGIAHSGVVLDQYATLLQAGGSVNFTLLFLPPTSNPNDIFLVAASISANLGTWSLGPGYSNLEDPTTSITSFAAESKVVTSTQSLAGSMSTSITNQDIIGIIVAFSGSAIGGSSPSASVSPSISPSASASASLSPSASISPSSSASASLSPSSSRSPSASISPSSSISPSASLSASLSPSASVSPSSSQSTSPSSSVSPSSSASPSISPSISPSSSRSPSSSASASISPSSSASLSSSPSASISPSRSPSSSSSASPSPSFGPPGIAITMDEPKVTASVDTDSSPVSIES